MIVRLEMVWTNEEIVEFLEIHSFIIEWLKGSLDDTALDHRITSIITAFRSRKERAFVTTAKMQTLQTAFPILALSNSFHLQAHLLEM